MRTACQQVTACCCLAGSFAFLSTPPNVSSRPQGRSTGPEGDTCPQDGLPQEGCRFFYGCSTPTSPSPRAPIHSGGPKHPHGFITTPHAASICEHAWLPLWSGSPAALWEFRLSIPSSHLCSSSWPPICSLGFQLVLSARALQLLWGALGSCCC